MNNPIERNEVSIHEVRVFLALHSRPDEWLTNKEIADAAKVAGRTARMHTLRFVRLGLLEQAEVFPAHRYRWSEKAEKRNVAYSQRLYRAAEVFQLT